MNSISRRPVTPGDRTHQISTPSLDPTSGVAIAELSTQIEALLERGRKLRDLKSSIGKFGSGKALSQTKATVFDDCYSVPLEATTAEPGLDMVATLNASDPLFMEEPHPVRVPFAETVVAKRKPRVLMYSLFRIDSIESSIPNLHAAMRSSGGCSSSITSVVDRSDCHLNVEVWQGSDLVAIGSTNMPKHRVECVGLLDGKTLAVVVLKIESSTDKAMLEKNLRKVPPRPKVTRRVKPVVKSSKLLQTCVLDATIYVPEEVLPISLMVPELSPCSPVRVVDCGTDPCGVDCSSGPSVRVVDEPIAMSECEIPFRSSSVAIYLPESSSPDSSSLVERHACNMRELEELTARLNHKSQSDNSPIAKFPPEISHFIPPPDFSLLCAPTVQVSHAPLRRRLFRRRGRKVKQILVAESLPFESESANELASNNVRANSPVSLRQHEVNKTAIDFSSSRQESIGKARRTLAELRRRN